MNKRAIAKQKEAVASSQALTMDFFMTEDIRASARAGEEATLKNDMPQNVNVLVTSGPGTGKTTQMIGGIVDELARGVKPEKILIMTYSREASDEFRDRLTKALEEKKVPGVRASDVEVKTFSSYAYELMRDQPGETKELMTREQARLFILDGLRHNNPKRYSDGYLSLQVGDFENAINYLKGFGLLPTNINYDLARKELAELCAKRGYDEKRTSNNLQFLDTFMKTFDYYETMKKAGGMYDYNDRLLLMNERLERGEGPYKRYDYVFVDGIQDMNQLESKIVENSGKWKRLIKDDKKAIYEFRGGGIEDAWSTTTMEGVVLSGAGNVNKRNLREISAYAQELFLRNVSNRKTYEADFAGLKNERTDRKGVVKLAVSEEQEETAAAIVKDIHDRGEEVAVIARTNAQLHKISELLDTLGIKWSGKIRGSGEGRAKKDALEYLKGLFYNEPEIVIQALFSPYSGITLPEAYDIKEKFNRGEITWEGVKEKAQPFFSIKDKFTRDKVKDVFTTWMVPLAISISNDHYLVCKAIYKSLDTYVSKEDPATRENLFDYLSLSTEGYESIGEGNGVLLATVHKAKSKWLDNVVYLPKYFRNESSLMDNVKYAIMKSTAGIDIIEKTKDEPAKVDFVAVTRARNELYIIAPQKLRPRYYIEGFIEEMKPKKIEIRPEPLKMADVLSGVRRPVDTRDGYRDMIYDHFRKNEHMSFTRVSMLEKPYEYLIAYIAGLDEKNSGMVIGGQIHEIAEKFFRKTLAEGSLNETERKFLDNIKEVRDRLAVAFKAKQIDAEYEFSLDVSEIFPDVKKGTVFTGKIDAVFEVETPKGRRYILLDYKTDKEGTWLGAHLRQVATYRKAFVVKKRGEGIEEKNVDVVVAYIGKNTGDSSFGIDLYSSMPAAGMKTVSQKQLTSKLEEMKEDVQKMLEYRADPEKFVVALLQQTPKAQRDTRFKMIERALLEKQGVVLKDIERTA
jgi:DNA helicase-2/ATP-dependent DNA helicase PcrA